MEPPSLSALLRQIVFPAAAIFAGIALPAHVRSAPPRPDHVLIVIEENHAFSQIIGNPDAPYINSLATSGANFTNCYGITHPSQPNYLQFFSGSNQGVTDNTAPAPGSPFFTPNLASNLIAAGATFVGYSEDLPAVGSTVDTNLDYWRKHNPWVNWQSDPPGLNQLPSALNRPYFSAGTTPVAFFGDLGVNPDFAVLPDLTIVVPNQQNDMHDGTIDMADTWLMTHVKPYVDWCASHNSLFILTWDEDNSAGRNRIPTLFVGPMIVPGQYPQTYTLHNLHRTVADMFDAASAGSAAQCRPMVGCFAGDPPIATRTFRQGENGYVDAVDTWLESAAPGTTHGSAVQLVADGSPASQTCVKFASLFGSGPNQVPPGVTVLSAKLLLLTGPSSANGDSSLSAMQAHRMIAPWSDASTWNSLAGGVSADDVEAAAVPAFRLIPNVLDAWAVFDVTADVQAFAVNPALNRGWAVLPQGTDGWRFASSETPVIADRPLLEITYNPISCRAVITDPPIDLHVLVGQPATFSVSATGTAPIAYQWRNNGEPLAEGGSISGSTGGTLSISPVAPSDAGNYDVILSSPCGSVTSAAARLVICTGPPDGDLNIDGLVDGRDIAEFTSAVGAGGATESHLCHGDFNLDAAVTAADLSGFLNRLLSQ